MFFLSKIDYFSSCLQDINEKYKCKKYKMCIILLISNARCHITILLNLAAIAALNMAMLFGLSVGQ